NRTSHPAPGRMVSRSTARKFPTRRINPFAVSSGNSERFLIMRRKQRRKLLVELTQEFGEHELETRARRMNLVRPVVRAQCSAEIDMRELGGKLVGEIAEKIVEPLHHCPGDTDLHVRRDLR